MLSFLEDGNNADSIYLDFSKAFDKVDLGILCHKLRDLGVSGKLGVWLHNFLSDRKQSIIVNGAKLSHAKVKSGVPQETVLGHILIYLKNIEYKDNKLLTFPEIINSLFAEIRNTRNSWPQKVSPQNAPSLFAILSQSQD